MNDKTGTAIIERERVGETRPKKSRIDAFPLWSVGIILLIVLAFMTVAMIGKMRREGKAGVMEAVYSARPPTKVFSEDVPVKVPQFNHVIFRLGDDEVFRCTYEDGGDGRRCSFEVREGGS